MMSYWKKKTKTPLDVSCKQHIQQPGLGFVQNGCFVWESGGNDANVCSAGWCQDINGTVEGTFLHHYRTVCWHTI